MVSRLLAVLAVFLLVGCQTIKVEDGTTTVRNFGAGTTTVLDDGTVETTSPGFSEGFSGVLSYLIQTGANLVALVLPFPAPAAPAPAAPEPTAVDVPPHAHTVH